MVVGALLPDSALLPPTSGVRTSSPKLAQQLPGPHHLLGVTWPYPPPRVSLVAMEALPQWGGDVASSPA